MVRKILNSGMIICCVLLFFTLLGCELFTIPQRGRQRPGDENAQITGFHALQLADGSVTAEFAWKPQSFVYDSYDRVTDVRLFMHKGSPYTLPVHIWDGENLEGRLVDYEDGILSYSEEWTDISSGEDVWITLYYSSEQGWYAPLFDRVKIQPTVPEPSTYSGPIEADVTVSIGYEQGEVIENLGTNYHISSYNSPDGKWIAVLIFNGLRNYDLIQGAELGLDVVNINGTEQEIYIAPLFSFQDDERDIMEKVDTDAELSIDLTAMPVDVSSVIKKAALYDTYSVVLYTDDSQDIEAEIAVNSETLQNITYFRDN